MAEAQPTDEEIVPGWTEQLSNTVVTVSNWGPQHFCADGTRFFTNDDTGELIECDDGWQVKQNPAISPNERGIVKVFDWLEFSRSERALWHTGTGSEVSVARSVMCPKLSTG